MMVTLTNSHDTLEEQFTLDLSDSTSFNSLTSPTIPSVATVLAAGQVKLLTQCKWTLRTICYRNT